MSGPVKTGVAMACLLGIAQMSVADELGQKIAMQGNGKGATACIACHGVDGSGMGAAGFPRLAGMEQGQLAKQLKDFQQGSRANPVMAPVAKALDDAEISAVAAYYAKLDAPSTAAPAQADPAALALGERLALRGNWDKDVPACVACHGPGGQGIGAAFPSLAGQHASYIAQQIRDWKSGARHNDPVQLMKAVSDKLTDEEIEAVSVYFASLPVSAN